MPQPPMPSDARAHGEAGALSSTDLSEWEADVEAAEASWSSDQGVLLKNRGDNTRQEPSQSRGGEGDPFPPAAFRLVPEAELNAFRELPAAERAERMLRNAGLSPESVLGIVRRTLVYDSGPRGPVRCAGALMHNLLREHREREAIAAHEARMREEREALAAERARERRERERESRDGDAPRSSECSFPSMMPPKKPASKVSREQLISWRQTAEEMLRAGAHGIVREQCVRRIVDCDRQLAALDAQESP